MKNQKMTKTVRKFLGAAAILLCLHLSTFGSYAYTKTTGTVIPATAKIRSEASTTSEAVGSTSAGKTVSIVDEVTGSDGSTWYQIEVDASTKGYIRSDLVTKAESSDDSSDSDSDASTTTSSTTSATASVTEVDSQAATVSTASANVRKSASTTADVISSVTKGTAVTITGETTGDDGKRWYQITFNSGSSTGFIRADLVTAGEASETEVSGTKSTDTDTEDAAEETTETTTEEETTQEATEETTDTADTSTGTGEVTILNTEETPELPSGFQEVSVTLNDNNVRAWKNGDFYIFYAQGADGTEGYYMYDSVDTTYQRYFMTNIEQPTGDDTSVDLTKFLKPIVIGMAVVLVILLIIVMILAIKMNEYKDELAWGSEDEDEEEEEEEEEEIPVRSVKKKKRIKHVVEEEEDEEEEDDEEEEEIVVKRVPKKQPQMAKVPVKTQPKPSAKSPAARPVAKKTPVSKPRNFIEAEEEEIPVTRNVKKKPAFTPISDDLDPDDEDTFVFINLDGDDFN